MSTTIIDGVFNLCYSEKQERYGDTVKNLSFTDKFVLASQLAGARSMEDFMVKHVILWKLKSTLTEEEKEKVKAGIKEGLEGLKGKIPGLLDIKVQAKGLISSNADVMLDSSFVSEEALKGYSSHPAHVEVADSKVRPYTEIRLCLDYEEE